MNSMQSKSHMRKKRIENDLNARQKSNTSYQQTNKSHISEFSWFRDVVPKLRLENEPNKEVILVGVKNKQLGL